MQRAGLGIRRLAAADAAAAAALVSSQPPGYARFFHALAGGESALATIFAAAERDLYAGIFWDDALICVYMLRGWDAGYEVPTFGLIVDAAQRGRRVLDVAIEAARLAARMNGAERLMVKVHPDNPAATQGALRLGFRPSAEEPRTGNVIYHMDL
jgi:GNAT superfamily N-acetyltransferase